MKRLSRRRTAMVAAPAPVDPRDLCAVLTCTSRWTVARHGFGLCAKHDAERTHWWQTNAEHLDPVVNDWTAEGNRPAGQPGEVGRNHGAGASWTYPAVRDEQGRVWFFRDTTSSAGRWIHAPARLTESFIPGEEWQADCDHAHSTPWRTCDTEADCISLRREHERIWGDR